MSEHGVTVRCALCNVLYLNWYALHPHTICTVAHFSRLHRILWRHFNCAALDCPDLPNIVILLLLICGNILHCSACDGNPSNVHIFTVLHFTFFPDSTLAKLYSALDCPVLRFTFQILPSRENFTVHWMFSRQSTHCKSFKGKTNCEEFGNYKHHYKTWPWRWWP